MKHVQFYYFISDNCALVYWGLIDLSVGQDINLQQQFKTALAIPVETIGRWKPFCGNDLLSSFWNPVTAQANSMEKFGCGCKSLLPNLNLLKCKIFESVTLGDQASILEMAYDHLFTKLIARPDCGWEDAQPRIENCWVCSQIDLEKNAKSGWNSKVDP